MVKKCYITNSQGNYIKDKQVKVFRLPTDLKERKLWLSVIPRDDIADHRDLVVCEKHQPANYPKVIYYGKERPRDPPSVFLCVKKTLIPAKLIPGRTTRKANLSCRNSQPDESNPFNQIDKISSFYGFVLMLVNQERISTNDMYVIVNELHIILQGKTFVYGIGVSELMYNNNTIFK